MLTHADFAALGADKQAVRWAEAQPFGTHPWNAVCEPGLLLRLALSAGVPRTRVVPVFLELVRARVERSTPASRALLVVVDRFLAGTATMAELERADAALGAEYTPRAPAGYDFGGACAIESASQVLQGWPTDGLGAGWFLTDGLTEWMDEEQLSCAAHVIRRHITELEVCAALRAQREIAHAA